MSDNNFANLVNSAKYTSSSIFRLGSAFATTQALNTIRNGVDPTDIEALVAKLSKPKHKLIEYLSTKEKVDISIEPPEYFRSADEIKDHVNDNLVAFSSNDLGIPYIWKFWSSTNKVINAYITEFSNRFDALELDIDLEFDDLDSGIFRVVVISYGEPSFDENFFDIDLAVTKFIELLYMTDGLEQIDSDLTINV